MKTSCQYQPVSRPWSAAELFSQVEPGRIRLNAEQRETFREFFWYDLCAEYDAVNLYREIQARRGQFTAEFLDFAEAWYRDERTHAEGFAIIYELLFGVSQDELRRRLNERRADFTVMEEFFADEFRLCVLFAYDEFASLMTYQKDTFYAEFGPPEFVTWIRRLRSDEALHFSNLVRLAQLCHAPRLGETKEVLRRVAEIESQRHEYQATFLFDHECPHFLLTQEELSGECLTRVLRRMTDDKTALMG